MGQIQHKLSQHQPVIKAVLGAALVVFAGEAAAVGTLGTVAGTITQSFTQLAKLITATAYIAGMGFAVGSIMKFKAHKDNPAQEPIGKPVGLLMVAAALLFLPTLLGVTGKTVFGTSTTPLGPTGVSSFGK